jgi:hypothetical protein
MRLPPVELIAHEVGARVRARPPLRRRLHAASMREGAPEDNLGFPL